MQPSTLIVGASSEISKELIKKIGDSNLILITRNPLEDIDSNNIKQIKHNLEFDKVNYKKIDNVLVEKNWYIKNMVYLSSYQMKRSKLTENFEGEIIKTINVNLTYCICLIRDILIKRPKLEGSFVLVGSQSVVLGGNEIAVYTSTKAAIETLVKSLAREVGSYGLRFNCISPASIKTKKIIEMDEGALKSTIERIPLGRLGKPKEVADLITWLMSQRSSYINGISIPITGGK